MNLLQKISPLYVPPSMADKGDLLVIRERILQSVLLITFAIGLPGAISASWNGYLRHEYYLIPIYALLILMVGVVVFARDLSFSLRGHVFVFLLYLLAVSELFESGQMGEVRMMLLTYTAVTAVLFGVGDVIFSIILSVSTIIATGIIIGTGAYSTMFPGLPATLIENLRQGTDSITGSIIFTMLSLIIAGSIAMIIDNLMTNLKKQAELTESLEYERDTLDDRIQERTRSMARRMVQLRTAADISRTISALSEPETLLQRVVDVIKERFDLYYVGIFVLDTTHQYAVLQAATGDAGKRMLSQGHQLAVGGSSMIGWSIANRKARIALDVGAEAVRFSNPNLPLTRSELALPIIAHDYVLGAMTIQSEKPNAFDENDIAILESIADSLAIALENDRLYHETRQSLDEIRTLNREYLQRAWSETIETYGALAYDYENPAIHERSAENTIQVPLLLRDEIIGHVTLEMDRPSLSDEETAFINNVTMQTAVALENARLLHETERRAVQEQKLNELTTRFSRALSIDEILRSAAQELGQLPAVAEVSVHLNPTVSPQQRPAQQKPSNPPNLPGSGNGKERA